MRNVRKNGFLLALSLVLGIVFFVGFIGTKYVNVYAEADTENLPFSTTRNDFNKTGISMVKDRVPEEDRISIFDTENFKTFLNNKNLDKQGFLNQSSQEYSTEIFDNTYYWYVGEAIKEANAQGKYAYFPTGVYYMKNTTVGNPVYNPDIQTSVVRISDVKICGDGESTIFKTAEDVKIKYNIITEYDADGNPHDKKDYTIWDKVLHIANADNVIVRDICFDGNNKKVEKIENGDQEGFLQLTIESCNNVEIFGCKFRDNNNGNLNFRGHNDNVNVYYCEFLNSDVGVLVQPGYLTNSYICNNFFDGQKWELSEPISLYYSPAEVVKDTGDTIEHPNENVVISGNNIRNHTQAAGGIFVTYPSTNILIEDNYILKCGAGIGCGKRGQEQMGKEPDLGPDNVIVRNNIIDNPTWHGIQLVYSTNWTIENNVIKNLYYKETPNGNFGGEGIILEKCENMKIYNNTIQTFRDNPEDHRICFVDNYDKNNDIIDGLEYEKPINCPLVSAQYGKDKDGKSCVILKWDKVEGADYYQVYKYFAKSNTFQRSKDTRGNSVKIYSIEEGKNYRYVVQAVSRKGISKSLIKECAVSATVGKTENSVNVSDWNYDYSNNTLTLKWEGNAEKYYIYKYYLSSKVLKESKEVTKNSCKYKNIDSGKNYRFLISTKKLDNLENYDGKGCITFYIPNKKTE
ncbi:parallel beta-helix repeat (two copies) [Lachnospiraceae bacterium RM5]|nr:parallel beta-helix repeat (two copies) [Lachnospiraceae bacterium RM5]